MVVPVIYPHEIGAMMSPIKLVAWGEAAMSELGVRTVCQDFIFIVDDSEIEEAAQKLLAARFRLVSWTYGTRAPPEFFQGNPKRQEILKQITVEYAKFDSHAKRLLMPPEMQAIGGKMAAVLLPSSYAQIQYPSNPNAEDKSFEIKDNIAWPSKEALLQSFVQVIVREPIEGSWTINLTSWAVTYVYGEAWVKDDVLDSCDDEKAKIWFNKQIRRHEGGIDRVTCTKLKGKDGYDDSEARRKLAEVQPCATSPNEEFSNVHHP